MRSIFLFLILTIVATSCSRKTIEVATETPVEIPIVHNNIEYRWRTISDTVRLVDSVIIKGDTVRLWHSEIQRVNIIQKDTVYMTDTISVPTYITKTVTETKKTMPWYWAISILVGSAAILALLIRWCNK